MTDRELMQQALEALVESVDLVSNAYEADWRHGLPTRKAQLDGMKAGVEFHEATITALRERLADNTVHSCSYYCTRPDCVRAQRDELRERLAREEPTTGNVLMDAYNAMESKKQAARQEQDK